MKKKYIVICSFVVPLLNGFSQQVIKQEDIRYATPLEVISVVGRVLDESRRPLAGIKVEIRLAYSLEHKAPEIAASEDEKFNDLEYIDWKYLLETIGTTESFASAETDQKGFYRLPGILFPGAYFLMVRRSEHYFPLKIPVLIPKTGAKEFEVAITLKAATSSPEKQRPAAKSASGGQPDAPTPGRDRLSGQSAKSTSAQQPSKRALDEMVEAKKAMQSDHIDEAIRHFRKAIEIEPEFGEAHYNLGGLLRQKGEIDDAVGHFEEAIRIKGDYPAALFYLGETLHTQKKHSESNSVLTRLLGTASKEETKLLPQAHYLIGANYFHLKQPEEAISFLSKAVELDPKIHPNAYIFLGNSHLLAGDAVNAMKKFKTYLDLYPDAPNVPQVKDILGKLESLAEKKK